MSRHLFSRALGASLIVLLGAATFCPAVEINANLDLGLDQFGLPIVSVQIYQGPGDALLDVGLYDTGASVITFSVASEGLIPVISGAVAGGSGIGGDVFGAVSKPGAILADGLEALSIEIDTGFNFTIDVTTNPQAAVPNIQAFVGTLSGSPNLPTLTGTPIHNPSVAFPGGSAAWIKMAGLQLDLGYVEPLIIPLPDLDFVAPGTSLVTKLGSSSPATIALGAFGENNYANPGDGPTSATNPTFDNVTLRNQPGGGPGAEQVAAGKRLLFDTGAQVTLISTELAASLGLDLGAPQTLINVQGASGNPITIPGFVIGGIELPAAVDGPLDDDLLKFNNIPVFVYDLNIPGLDGILGMNAFNTADELMIDLINGQLSVTFFDNPDRHNFFDDDPLTASLLTSMFTAFSGHIAPAFGLGPAQVVPEPSTAVLVLLAAGCLIAWRRRTGKIGLFM